MAIFVTPYKHLIEVDTLGVHRTHPRHFAREGGKDKRENALQEKDE